MTKPGLIKVPETNPIKAQIHERYLPNAFDESMSILEKMNKIIYYMQQIGKITQEMLDKWNEVYDWVMNEGLENAVNKKLEEWLKDGTLDKIINEKLFGELNRQIQLLISQMKELMDLETSFDIRDIQPSFISNLGGLRNAVNQSINIHPKTNDLYTTQSDSNTPEGFYLTKMNPSGHYDSAMWFPEGGHGTMVGLDTTRSGENPYIWTHHLASKKLIRIPYQDNKVFQKVDALDVTDYTPASLNGMYFSVTIDSYHDYMTFRREDGIIEIRKRTDVLNKIDNVLYSCTIPESERTDPRPMQGCVSYGSTIYYQSGNSEMSNPMKILKYDGTNGKLLFTHIVSDILAEEGMFEFRDDFKEPEGLAYYVHPKTGKHSLFFVLTSGLNDKRYHLLYAFHQRNAGDHWDSISKLGSQKYAFTRGDGRYFSLPDGTTHLNQVLRPGLYYATAGECSRIGGFPYPTQETGWEIYVGPMNQTYTMLQRVKRLSSTRRIMEFERVLSFDRETLTWSADKWTTNVKASNHQEYLGASDWDYKLSNVTIPGEYYLTSTQADAFTDVTSDGAGWRLTISSADLSENVRQTLDRNSSTAYQIKIRDVNSITKVANAWKTVHDIKL